MELNEDEESDSNSEKPPRVVGRCIHKSLPARREILSPIVAFVPVTFLYHMEDWMTSKGTLRDLSSTKTEGLIW